MAIKNSQSKRMALANMLKQNATKNQRMANFMSPTGAAGGLQSLTNPGNVPQQAAFMNSLLSGQQPTGPTGLTSNFYDPSYGIDRGFADQMTARNKAMQGMDSGQIQYDPASKSFFSVGARGQRGGPALSGTYDQMYHKYDINNQLAALGTSSAGGVGGMPRGGPFNAAQIDFINKNQDVYGPYSSPSDQNGNKLQAMKDAQAASQGGLSQPTQTQSVRPPLGGGYANSGKVNQPMPSTGYPKMDYGTFVDPIRSFNNGATPARNTQVKSAGLDALGSGANIGQATQSYPKQSQAPAGKPVNRGKLNQLMPTPGV